MNPKEAEERKRKMPIILQNSFIALQKWKLWRIGVINHLIEIIGNFALFHLNKLRVEMLLECHKIWLKPLTALFFELPKDLFIKNRSKAAVKLLLFYIDFLLNKSLFSKVNTKWKIFETFVAFSEYLNFIEVHRTNWTYPSK